MIITGANTGLGLDTAKEMYKMKPKKLILAVRSMARGEQARDEILNYGKNPEEKTDASPGNVIEVWELDMAKFESVKAFMSRCEKELDRLDILLLNAGVSPWTHYKSTSDGWETTVQVNVLSTFLLAICLAPLVVKTARLPAPTEALRPHLVVVSSEVHTNAVFKERNAPEIFKALNNEKTYEYGDRYMVTKLLEILLARQLVTELLPKLLSDSTGDGAHEDAVAGEKSKFVVCTVNPGWCRTTLLRDYPSLIARVMNGIMARKPIEGVKCYLWACFNNDIPLGGFSSFCAVERESDFVYSDAGKKIQQRVWDELIDILADVEPRVKTLVKG